MPGLGGAPLSEAVHRLGFRDRVVYAPHPYDSMRLNRMLSEHLNLRDTLIPVASKVIGADEHVEFAALLSKARPYRLDVSATRSLAHAIQDHAWSVEKSMDLLDLPKEGIWIEWPESGRFRHEAARRGAAYPVKSGGLLVESPDEPDVFVVMTGWMMADGSVRHSHAAARFSKHLLARWAWQSRNDPTLSRSRDEVLKRLLDQGQVYFPPGLRDEFEFLLSQEAEEGLLDVEATRTRAIRTMQLDVVEDLPFILTAALFLTAGCADVVAGAEDANVRLKGPGLAGKVAPMLARIGMNRYGFWRLGTAPRARVVFVRPVERRLAPEPSLVEPNPQVKAAA